MIRQKRIRTVCRMDKEDRLRVLSVRRPDEAAARQFVHKAYESYTVDGYMKSKGMSDIGQQPS
ncbi:hypothetical protein [Dorea sp. D27]|uniref:hypothetical protein n=1 Tax=Dorea sp. D27 TaxID=658665 RepID=UPI0006733753|nr:hypothetical protein [Dorea sp. D27]KMZ52375.1 hypothetical protein HMPREF0980_03579 [Dorea sp. D27]